MPSPSCCRETVNVPAASLSGRDSPGAAPRAVPLPNLLPRPAPRSAVVNSTAITDNGGFDALSGWSTDMLTKDRARQQLNPLVEIPCEDARR